MKKLLFISYFFPPIQSGVSIRALNAIKYLPGFGWESVVVAAKRSKGTGFESRNSFENPGSTPSLSNLFMGKYRDSSLSSL